ncbi:MAG: hypothetical protein OXD33_13025 [Rhodobacteraceae bacterium]|nr:hypothetical protein [Paracoccaceae bacterium]
MQDITHDTCNSDKIVSIGLSTKSEVARLETERPLSSPQTHAQRPRDYTLRHGSFPIPSESLAKPVKVMGSFGLLAVFFVDVSRDGTVPLICWNEKQTIYVRRQSHALGFDLIRDLATAA